MHTLVPYHRYILKYTQKQIHVLCIGSFYFNLFKIHHFQMYIIFHYVPFYLIQLSISYLQHIFFVDEMKDLCL